MAPKVRSNVLDKGSQTENRKHQGMLRFEVSLISKPKINFTLTSFDQFPGLGIQIPQKTFDGVAAYDGLFGSSV
jgi:hypothetical protein